MFTSVKSTLATLAAAAVGCCVLGSAAKADYGYSNIYDRSTGNNTSIYSQDVGGGYTYHQYHDTRGNSGSISCYSDGYYTYCN